VLGAGRARLVRLQLVESLVLALGGAAIGVLIAWGGLKGLVAALPQNVIPAESVIELNAPVLAFTLGVAVLTALIFGLAPAFGQFLSPQHGFWQNAEAVDKDFNQDLRLPGLKDPAEIYLDDRLVPHVFAANEIDAFYIQGYLHARFRLWQMEFQTYAAGGRISELVGPRATSYDREKRRLGMVYSAEKTVAEMEKDPETKAQLDAYTAGVNEYINHLTESELPLEYKLLGYQPELWTNLKTALLMKYMSLDLSGAEDDFEFTKIRTALGYAAFEKMFPLAPDSLDPIVPVDTIERHLTIIVKAPANSDCSRNFLRCIMNV